MWRRRKSNRFFYVGCVLKERKKRQLQDSNLRGQSPTDFESVSLTTRTNCLGNLAISSVFQTHTPTPFEFNTLSP